jgi:exopolyphosphatase/pppGpp-phosphohydrolase
MQQATAILQASAAIPDPIPLILGVGGTATALGRLTRQSHGVTSADLARAWETLAGHPVAELTQTTGIDAGRLRLLVGGVVAWQAILAHTGAQRMMPSERGVREGAVVAWLHAGDAWVDYARQAAP